mgnify:CR=1 FL=1
MVFKDAALTPEELPKTTPVPNPHGRLPTGVSLDDGVTKQPPSRTTTATASPLSCWSCRSQKVTIADAGGKASITCWSAWTRLRYSRSGFRYKQPTASLWDGASSTKVNAWCLSWSAWCFVTSFRSSERVNPSTGHRPSLCRRITSGLAVYAA